MVEGGKKVIKPPGLISSWVTSGDCRVDPDGFCELSTKTNLGIADLAEHCAAFV